MLLVFERTSDHKIPAKNVWFQIAGNIEKEFNTEHLKPLDIKRGFLGNFTRARVVVQGTVIQEVPTTKKRKSHRSDTW